MNLGGEYLPALAHGEVEIARVALASTTGDVQSIRARRTEEGIRVVVVDEYENGFVDGERVSERPLTLRELTELIDGSHIDGADGSSGGLVLGVVRDWFADGVEAADLLTSGPLGRDVLEGSARARQQHGRFDWRTLLATSGMPADQAKAPPEASGA